MGEFVDSAEDRNAWSHASRKACPGEANSERVVLERDMIRPSVHPVAVDCVCSPSIRFGPGGCQFSQQRITGLALHHPAHGERLVKPDLPGVSSFPRSGEREIPLFRAIPQ